MTEQDKQLLLADLCARLPYEVKVQYDNEIYNVDYVSALYEEVKLDIPDNYTVGISEIKIYLRPMSSMTEEELNELKSLCSFYIPSDSNTIGFEDYGILVVTHRITNNTYSFKLNTQVIDWLNAHHFDYRRLIQKGLALEAPEDIYKQ